MSVSDNVDNLFAYYFDLFNVRYNMRECNNDKLLIENFGVNKVFYDIIIKFVKTMGSIHFVILIRRLQNYFIYVTFSNE